MKIAYKITRSLLMIVLVLFVAVPGGLYIALSLDFVQDGICRRAEKELTRLLDSNVDIDHISITPFNRLTLHGVRIDDDYGHPALAIDRLGAGIRLGSLIVGSRIVVDYAEIIGMDAKISRDSVGAPLNISRIIAALQPGDTDKPKSDFDVAVNVLVVRKSSLEYEVLNMPDDTMRFNPSRIYITDLKADILIPSIRRDDYRAEIRRLSLKEHSGFDLKLLKGRFGVTGTEAEIDGLEIEMPGTHLRFSDIRCQYPSLDSLKMVWPAMETSVAVEKGSYVTPADFRSFLPELAHFDRSSSISFAVEGCAESFAVHSLKLDDSGYLSVAAEASVHNLTHPQECMFEIPEIKVVSSGETLSRMAGHFSTVDARVSSTLSALGQIELTAGSKGSCESGSAAAALNTEAGRISLDLDFNRVKNGVMELSGSVLTDGLTLSGLMEPWGQAAAGLSFLSMDGDFNIIAGHKPSGTVNINIPRLDYRDHTYTSIAASATVDGHHYFGSVTVDNPDVMLLAEADVRSESGKKTVEFDVNARDIDLAALNLSAKFPAHRLSFIAQGQLEGADIDHIAGQVSLNDLRFVDAENRGLEIKEFNMSSRLSGDGEGVLTLKSDVIDGRIDGQYRFSRLPEMARSLAATVFPQLIGKEPAWPEDTGRNNDFIYSFTLKETRPFEQIVKLPVRVIYPVSLFGRIDESSHTMSVNLDAPYLQQGDKLIESTSMQLRVAPEPGDDRNTAELSMSTLLPTKRGPMSLLVDASARNDAMDSRLQWNVKRERAFNGTLRAMTRFSRDDEGGLATRIDLNRSQLVFNDTAWTVEPSRIYVAGKEATVQGFRVGHGQQFITLEGKASSDSTDSLTLTLRDVSLDYIFETLDISNAQFGGNATGSFFASDVFSRAPRLYTRGLDVKRLKYNGSVLGDTRLQASWVPETGAVDLHADISQENGGRSTVDGAIFALNDSLDLRFKAQKLPIGFLQYFMSAFASEVDGFASGDARLWGSFKNIDMAGDVYGEDVRIKLDFTNTSYLTTDSIHLRPGRIDIPDITIRDIDGNTARLSGWLTHKCFHEPEFRFNVTDARRLLVYDVKESPDARWYGHVFGNGSASVTGVPGRVGINVNMRTTANSSFTFVLSDALNAQEYNFLTFRDRDRAKKDSIAALDPTPAVVRELKARLARQVAQGSSTAYGMDISVDVTPEALVTIVMDPVGGDKIRANGSGNLRMTYDSADEDLHMFGAYTLQRGSYNFTLQDIIIKDFTIRDGSSITFHGDPYAAQLDINAVYAVNANLSDLDESFLEDRELNRTNVPVNAMMHVTGDMRQPDINFDLEFPTLTQDTYRKVRSIVSTEEMMNRQIIYLLALSRFYTPDYMNATRGSELVSMASSTLSSQLGSMLGQLSDKWNIAPAFRSDRGDFSDVEVDMALSSHLLNNRLLLNGNFGYRDKALNNNSFIGDFDIEYLLNKSGSIRLKAYNRYNDQNYYVKAATTTQGVGVEFKRDFDSMTSFLQPILKWFRRKNKKKKAEKTDSVSKTAVMPDTTALPAMSPEIILETPSDTLKITPVRTQPDAQLPPPAPGHGRIVF